MREQRIALKDQADIALRGRHLGDLAIADLDAPEVGAAMPAISDSIVVLPEPLGPRIVVNSPELTASEMSPIACTDP